MLPPCNCFQRWRWTACWRSVLPPSPSVRSVSFFVSCFPYFLAGFSLSQVCFLPRFLLSFFVSSFPCFLSGFSLSQVSLIPRFLLSFLMYLFPCFLDGFSPQSGRSTSSFNWVCFPAEDYLRFLLHASLCPLRPSNWGHQLKNTLTVFFANQVAFSFSACNDIDDSSIKEVKNWRRRQNWYFCGRHALGCNGIGWMRREQLIHLLCRLQEYNHKENQNNLSPALSY